MFGDDKALYFTDPQTPRKDISQESWSKEEPSRSELVAQLHRIEESKRRKLAFERWRWYRICCAQSVLTAERGMEERMISSDRNCCRTRGVVTDVKGLGKRT